MMDRQPSSTTARHGLDLGSPDEIKAYFTRDATRFQNKPHINLIAARINARNAADQVRFLLSEEPAQYVGRRSQMDAWQAWGKELAMWVTIWRHGADLVERCRHQCGDAS